MNRCSRTLLMIAIGVLALSAPELQASAADAQTEKSWVFFSDKGISGESQLRSAIAELTASYDARAIRRRELRRTLPGLFDESDLPLKEAYVEAVAETGVEVCVRSRWLNAVSVRATPAQQDRILALPCVRSVRAVRTGKGERAISPSAVQARGGRDFYGLAQPQLAQIGVTEMHAQGYTGAGVVIGILDTGFHRGHVAYNEPGHELQVVAEWDFVNDDPFTGIEPGDAETQYHHGTFILGTMGAYKPDELVGGAYDASFILAKVEDVTDEYPLEEDYFTAGLEFIEANGGDVVTSSVVAFWYEQDALDGETSVMSQAFNIATANGLHCCQGAGNEGHDLDPLTSHLLAPADAFDVLTVGAVDEFDDIVSFSSDGPTWDGRVKPEVLARGLYTWTVHAESDTDYDARSGTSLATPLMAAAVACIVQAHPDWPVPLMRDRLMRTANYYLAWGTYDPFFVRGYGIIDAALAAEASTAAPPEVANAEFGVSRVNPNPFRGSTTITFAADRAGEMVLELFDLRGRRIRTIELGQQAAGERSVTLSETALPGGLYLYRIQSGANEIAAGKLLLLN